jgi:septum formation protein
MDSLVLASKSPRRREILKQLGLPFIVCSIDIDEEKGYRRTVRSSVMNLSRKKVDAAAVQFEEGLIVGVDTVVHFNGRVLGKPESGTEARLFLKMLSGNSHQVLSGITVRDACSGLRRTSCSVSTVHFTKMDVSEIDRYVQSDEWVDKAGGYAIQGRAALYIRSIEGSYYNIVGMPVEELYRLLKGFSYFSSEGAFRPRRRMS